MGSGSLNHLKELDQLNAKRASGKRRRTWSAKRSTGSRSEVGTAEILGHRARHTQLADHLVRGDERLATDVAAALRENLVLEMRGRDARGHVQLGGALDVEEVAIPAVHVDDDGRDLEMLRRSALVRVTHGHRELEFAQRRDRAASAVGDLRPGVQIHVGGAEVSDGERVAAEVDGLEAVVHRELRALRVVDPGAEEERFAVEELAHARARIRPARCGDDVTLR